MRLQRHGMIQTKVGVAAQVQVQRQGKTGRRRLMGPLSLCFQDQYLFCYKVWLEVLQGILQLHGNQWQPESPQDHKVV